MEYRRAAKTALITVFDKNQTYVFQNAFKQYIVLNKNTPSVLIFWATHSTIFEQQHNLFHFTTQYFFKNCVANSFSQLIFFEK